MQNAPYLSAVPPEEGKKSLEESRIPGTGSPIAAGQEGLAIVFLGWAVNSLLSWEVGGLHLVLVLPSACCVTCGQSTSTLWFCFLICDAGVGLDGL